MIDSIKASAQGLETVDRARRYKKWNKTAEVWCQEAFTSKATLNRFWARQPIRRETFIAICSAVQVNWEEIAELDENPSIELEKGFALPQKIAPVRNWVGRQQELNTLKAQILPPEPEANTITSICIVGLAGIGKTTLASQLLRHLRQENAPFVAAAWESLDSVSGKPPRFDGIIDSLLINLSHGQISEVGSSLEDYYQKTEQLVQLLKEQPCLVVFDNVDAVLTTKQAKQAGYFADDCAEYTWLFKQLTQTEHQSKVILTSRETLAQLSRAATYTLRLDGLDEGAAITLLQSFDLIATSEELAILTQRYHGHPKAMEMVSALICEEFQGRVSRFLRDRKWLLIRDLDSLIDEVMMRLSAQEHTCLSLISVYQTSEFPLLYEGIAAQMPAQTERDLKENIILALKRRHLLDYNPALESYQMHPLVQEKAAEFLDPESYRQAHRSAYSYFMNIPLTRESEWKGLEHIKPRLIAHYHACQAKDWDEAATAISDVYEYLRQRGYFIKLIDLYKNLICRDGQETNQLVTSAHTHGEILCRLGIAYHSLGRLEMATDYLQKSLVISHKLSHRPLEATALFYIALNHQFQGNFQLAIHYLNECLLITKAIGDFQLNYKALEALGDNHSYQKDYQAAINLYTQSLEIARKNELQNGELSALEKLGNTAIALEDEQSAIYYLQDYRAAAEKLENKQGISYVLLADLANLYNKLGNYQDAIAIAQDSLNLTRTFRDSYHEANILRILGIAYRGMKKYKTSIEFLNQALTLAHEIVDPENEGKILWELEITHRELEQLVIGNW
ncbi:MAG TPA: hypothetical protein DDZ80_19935 [Cyanobacteria bacterium UBA8803]|nr:hypothetical protein [Cyanobacteria bacterium UBA9273]HBL60636.1 hypothetical protein [Cyanobacteria bacterium UBA8803]